MTRPLDDNWPTIVNSSGQPGTGTKITKQVMDAIKAAIAAAIYDPNLEEDPPGVAREMTEARGAYATVDARLDAIEVAAAGGAASSSSGGAGINLVPNDTFLIWSAGDNAAPDFWTAGTNITPSRENTVSGSTQTAYWGRNVVKLVASAAGEFYLDVVSADEVTTLNSPSLLKGRKVAAGAAIYTATQNLVEVHIDDGVTAIGDSTKVGSNYGVTGSWVWSADGHSAKGGKQLPASPTRLRLVVKMSGAGTAFIACPAVYFAESAPYYIPAPAVVRQMVFGQDAYSQILAGEKGRFYPHRPMHLIDARLLLAGAGSGVSAEVYKGASAVFGGAIAVTTGTDSGLKVPTSRALASFGVGDLLKVSIPTADATARGPAVAVRYVEYPRFIESGVVGA